ncbi:MAG: hypothetical protein ACPLKQ_01460 [Candidatus Bathyarchaeales archaeon]
MKTEEIKNLASTLNELNESYIDFLHSMKESVKEVKVTKKLWKNGEKPWLIKLGLALILFPDPTISDVIGSLLVAAGTVQEGLRRRALHVEDIPKTFQSIMKEIQATEERVTRKLC